MAHVFFGRLWIVVGFMILFALRALASPQGLLAVATWRDVQNLNGATVSEDVPVTDAARAVLQDARSWRGEVAPLLPMTGALGWLPRYGGEMGQAPALAAFGDELLNAVEPSLQIYDALSERLATSDSFGKAIIALAQEDAAQIANARAAVERVKQARAGIGTRDLSPEGHRLLEAADEAVAEWDSALQLLEQAPVLLGNDGPRSYLVLAQNNDEVRPTGGFISAVGLIRVEKGQIHVETFGDSFAADDLTLIHPPPPLPLQKYMLASQWLLRDSNWYANFPTSAETAESMYAFDHHLRPDGVIAVDTRFLPRLIAAMPGVELGGKPLTAGDVLEAVKASWQPMPPGDMSAVWFANDRKNFLSELMNGVMTRFSAGEVNTTALGQAVWRGLREKSVQVYLNDAPAQEAVLAAGWGGAVEPGEGDYLGVVDANVGFNKVNAKVTREIQYDVTLDKSGGGQAEVTIAYRNPSPAADGGCDLVKQHRDNTYASMESSCYWNYVRVLAPKESILHGATGVTDAGTADEIDGVAAFGGYAVIPRDATGTVTFQYALPKVVRNDNYTLQLLAQAGIGETPITVRVQIPEGVQIRGANRAYTQIDSTTFEFHELLRRDATIEIYFEPGDFS